MIDDNPFLRYRHRLDVHRRWLASGRDDDAFVALVTELDAAVAAVDGRGFRCTPLVRCGELDAVAGAQVWVKDETGNVGGSHKARHLFGVALHLALEGGALEGGAVEAEPQPRELVISSCGNAAIGAAVVARAAQRRLRVFIPTWADETVATILDDLGAVVERCDRRPGEDGDPCYLRFREAVAAGARPFSVQGRDVPAALDGGRTIGWEIAEQASASQGGPGRVDVVPVQTGGGAFGTCVATGLEDGVEAGWIRSLARIHPVQTRAAAPLRRAWDLLAALDDPEAAAAAEPDRFMWPWEDVGSSTADGILDDVTYDWLPLLAATRRSGGEPVVVDEDAVLAAHRAGRAAGFDVSATGTAGLAALVAGQITVATHDVAVVVFSGVERTGTL